MGIVIYVCIWYVCSNRFVCINMCVHGMDIVICVYGVYGIDILIGVCVVCV
jgi:hypothetical protein